MKIVSAGVPCAIQYIDRSSAVGDLLDEAERHCCRCVLFVSQQLENDQKIAIKELDQEGIQEYGLFDAVTFLIKKHDSFQADLGTTTKFAAIAHKSLSKPAAESQSMASDSLVSAVELKIAATKTQGTGSCEMTPTNISSDVQSVPVSSQKTVVPLRMRQTDFDVGPKTDDEKETRESSIMLRKESHGSDTARDEKKHTQTSFKTKESTRRRSLSRERGVVTSNSKHEGVRSPDRTSRPRRQQQKRSSGPRYSRSARHKRSDGNDKRRRSFQRRSRSRSRSPVSSVRHTRVRRRSASPPRRRPIVITPRVNDRRKGRRTGERSGQRKNSASLLKKVKPDPEVVIATPEHRSESGDTKPVKTSVPKAKEKTKKKTRWAAPQPVSVPPTAVSHTPFQPGHQATASTKPTPPPRLPPPTQFFNDTGRLRESKKNFGHNVYRQSNPVFPPPFPHIRPHQYQMHIHGFTNAPPKPFQARGNIAPPRWNFPIQ